MKQLVNIALFQLINTETIHQNKE
jgi:hypothetical protein